jgi:hypothetical protein
MFQEVVPPLAHCLIYAMGLLCLHDPSAAPTGYVPSVASVVTRPRTVLFARYCVRNLTQRTSSRRDARLGDPRPVAVVCTSPELSAGISMFVHEHQHGHRHRHQHRHRARQALKRACAAATFLQGRPRQQEPRRLTARQAAVLDRPRRRRCHSLYHAARSLCAQPAP